jgi:hypothetical protein
MKKSGVNVEGLLNQLSEEKINRVVDANIVKAGWGWSEHSCYTEHTYVTEAEPEEGLRVIVGVGVGLAIHI